MKIEYSSNKLRKQLSTASEMKKGFGTNAKRLSNRLDDIIASPNLLILKQIPAANCHALVGDKEGQWAVTVTGNFRLIFSIANDPVPKKEDGTINLELVTELSLLEITDYH
ncbi:MAG: killer suppression protein HigA [Chitinophagaceae bacterium]|nr:killer suppression protein HigA [Chitinophagaceae bacterium]